MGYDLVKLNESPVNLNFEGEIIKINKYMEKKLLNNNEIKKIIYNIFIKNELREFIFNKTGFNFSIDYIIAYKTYGMSYEDKNKEWYANKWHIDKPFSKNTLKVIIPINEISASDGGIELLDRKKSREFKNDNFNKNLNYFKMSSKTNELLVFFPNMCFHRAGIPENNNSRTQIMIQLNPSKYWKVNTKIKDLQKKIEPKFPFFSYFFDKKEDLKIFCKEN